MELWQLWLLTTLDGWRNLSGFVLFFGIIGFVGSGVVWLATNNNPFVKKPNVFKILAWCMVASSFVLVLVPSTKGAWTMIGAYVGINAMQKAADIPGVKDLPPNVVNAMNKFLEQYVNEKENK